MSLVSWDCVRQAHLAHMQLHLITGNEVSYQNNLLADAYAQSYLDVIQGVGKAL